jgi:hypothetical protein
MGSPKYTFFTFFFKGFFTEKWMKKGVSFITSFSGLNVSEKFKMLF